MTIRSRGTFAASLVLSLLATVVGTTVATAPAAAAAGPPPNSIASLGDSITRGFNACGFFVDCPSRSWSTGTTTAVNSHYQRILAVNPAIGGNAFNNARSGAVAQELAGQADRAVSQGAQYVTILIGANDACASTEAGMTPVATFRARIDAGLSRLRSGLPQARVLVLSVPDVRRLWEIGKDSASARTAWSLLGICQSMLANPTSTAQADVDRRTRVRQRVIDYNSQLAQACTAYGANCQFDGNAVFGYPFVLSEVSGWDFFHPAERGQAALAQVSYAAGFGW